MNELHLKYEDIAYIGDDINDVQIMKVVKLKSNN